MNENTVLVVPLGAHEQHGPHLPFETDTLIAEGICARLTGAHVLPVEPVGYSPEHMDFPGTRTLAYDEAIERWIGIGHDAAERGTRRIVFMNAHGGNVPLVQIVCQELRRRTGMLAVATKWDRFVKHLVSDEEAALGVHGGEIETAVMLALQPDRVDIARAADFSNLQSHMTGHLGAYGPHAFGWMAQDLNPHGVTGNAAAATAETGERLIAAAVEGLDALIAEVAAFDLALLRDAPDLS